MEEQKNLEKRQRIRFNIKVILSPEESQLPYVMLIIIAANVYFIKGCQKRLELLYYFCILMSIFKAIWTEK